MSSLSSELERLAELERQMASVQQNAEAERLRFEHEVSDRFSTLNTPGWKRLLFRIDGWPAWHIVAERPAWRPWHRWWTS